MRKSSSKSSSLMNQIYRQRKLKEVAKDAPKVKSHIPSLVSIATDVVATNFALYPNLDGVKDQKVIKKTSTKLDITISAPNINDEDYWKLACQTEYPKAVPRPEDHGNSYKQAYVERYLERKLEALKSDHSLQPLKRDLRAIQYDVFSLNLTQLQSHLDVKILAEFLLNLNFLRISYGARHLGQKYDRAAFGMKMKDAEHLSFLIKRAGNLIHLSLPCNMIDNHVLPILLKGLVLNKTVLELDLSHNVIGNSCARKIAKFLVKNPILRSLNISNNQVGYQGSRYLGQALRLNKVLQILNLKHNRLTDKAGAKLLNDLLENNILFDLNISSNELSALAADKLAELLSIENSALKSVDISCNFIKENDVMALKAAIQKNSLLTFMDIRKNQIDKTTEEEINEKVTKNFLLTMNVDYVDKQTMLSRKEVEEDRESVSSASKQRSTMLQSKQGESLSSSMVQPQP